MKRYFIVHEDELPSSEKYEGHRFGEWHAIDLGSHEGGEAGFHAVVLVDENVTPPTSWSPLPHLLTRSALQPTHVMHLAPLGVLVEHSAYEAAMALAAIHPRFRP